MRHSLTAALLAAAAANGCHSDPVVVGNLQEVTAIPALPNPDLDLVFVIDNSPSMADKQANLVANFPAMMNVLSSLPDGLPNLHIGIITSDMGSEDFYGHIGPSIGSPGQQGACSGVGDDGLLQTGGAALGGDLYLSDVSDGMGGRIRNYTGTLADTFTQMATVGQFGCGFEQHLFSLMTSFANTSNGDFYRPTANLGIVILADEDDCSMFDSSLIQANTSVLGPLQSFRCFAQGVVCDPDDPNTPGPKSDCAPRASSLYVEDVQPFIDSVLAQKSDERMVMAAALAGDPTPVATELRAPVSGQAAIPALAHSCSYQDAQGLVEVADPAVRIQAFTDGFPGRNAFGTICQQDLSNPLQLIGESARRLQGDPCFSTAGLADADAVEPGVQPACAVTDVRDSDPDHPATLPACTASLATDCYQILADPSVCPMYDGHLRVLLHRSTTPAPDTWTHVICQKAS
ncbi:MAG TPA: hypothetical protein VGM88_09465 [Kofleriaceae bacterium]|jgi:hypothetical protein